MIIRHFNSFATRLSVYIITLTVLIFGIVMAVVYHYSCKKIVNHTIEQTHSLLENMSGEIETQLAVVESAIQNTAWVAGQNSNQPNVLPAILMEVVKNNPTISGCAIAFKPNYYPTTGHYCMLYANKDSADISCTHLGGQEYNYFEMEWYSVPEQTRKPHWSEPYFDNNGGERTMTTYSIPLLDKQGNFYAVLTADISLDQLNKLVDNLKVYPSSVTFIISRKGYYLAHCTKKNILNKTIFEDAAEKNYPGFKVLGEEMLAGHTGTLPLKKHGVIAFYTHIKSVGWSICNICPESIIFDELSVPSQKILLITLVGILLIFVITYFAIRQLVAPLTGFTRSTREIAKGNFDTPLPEIKTHDEMLLLHQSFEFMQQSLDNYIKELKITTAANERIESELHIARDIQMSMLPKIFPPFPKRTDINLFAMLKPAREVGGDLYDFFIQEEKLFFTIGDVSGKGVPASLFMAMTRCLFRTIATPDLTPEEMTYRLNNIITSQNEAGMFVTLFIGIIDLKTGFFTFCNAGHNKPILIRPDGNAAYMDIKPNIVAGIMEDYPFIGQNCMIESGTRLILYTDGVVEAENVNHELYGDNRLTDLLAGNTEKNAQTIIQLIQESVEEFAGEAEQSDDITMLVITLLNNKNQQDNTDFCLNK